VRRDAKSWGPWGQLIRPGSSPTGCTSDVPASPARGKAQGRNDLQVVMRERARRRLEIRTADGSRSPEANPTSR